MKKKFKIVVIILLAVCVFIGIWALCVNAYVKSSTKERIITADEALALEDVDCIIVLGCLVRPDGNPSGMLEDRLATAVSIAGDRPLLMSGDHGTKEYDEVNAMKKAAVDEGISSSDIFMDHAGFSTYESLYRAKEVFGAEKIIVVTQKYHLYRALYIAKELGIEAYGVSSDYRTYLGQSNREAREILARCKDFFKSVFKPEPTFLGEKIPLNGDGNITNG